MNIRNFFPLPSQLASELNSLSQEAHQSLLALAAAEKLPPMEQILKAKELLAPWRGRDFSYLAPPLEGRKKYKEFLEACKRLQNLKSSPTMLGGVWGLFTHPVEYWMSLPKEKLDEPVFLGCGSPGPGNPSVGDVIGSQASKEAKRILEHSKSLLSKISV